MDNDNNTTYYYTNNKRIKLIREPRIRVVKYKNNISKEIPRLSIEAKALLPDTARMLYIPKYNLHIYQTTDKTDELKSQELFSKLRSLPRTEENIDFVSLAYRLSPGSSDLLFTTKTFTARFKPEISKEDIDNLVSKNNVRIVRKLSYVENAYEMEAPDADGPNGPVALGNIFMETGSCLWAKASFIKQLHLRTSELSESNFLKQQWHLDITKTFDAWNITKGDPQIKINICDDGVDISHPEFFGKIVAEYDFEDDIADGNHKSSIDGHGTCCAGVAAGRGIKAAGAAPECSLIITRFPGRLNDIDEAEMFVWAADNGADIISCSWGPEDGQGLIVDLPDETREAIHYCITRGRQGKGCCIFWAAGNGNGESVDEDGYAANPDVMSIAASKNPDENGYEDRSPYSDIGKAVFLSAPSSGGRSDKAILSADRQAKDKGYNVHLTAMRGRPIHTPDQEGNYTDVFGGTSSATPLVAGIVGLILTMNPDLTEKEVRDILMRTAEKIGNKNTYKPDPVTGHLRSELFGYGRINALAAVSEARKLTEFQSTKVSERNNNKINNNYGTPLLPERIIRQRDMLKWL
jgi:subtilisin family serine protease